MSETQVNRTAGGLRMRAVLVGLIVVAVVVLAFFVGATIGPDAMRKAPTQTPLVSLTPTKGDLDRMAALADKVIAETEATGSKISDRQRIELIRDNRIYFLHEWAVTRVLKDESPGTTYALVPPQGFSIRDKPHRVRMSVSDILTIGPHDHCRRVKWTLDAEDEQPMSGVEAYCLVAGKWEQKKELAASSPQ